jgi:hypothetical protein
MTIAGVAKSVVVGDKTSFIVGTLVLILGSTVIAWIVTGEKP